MEINTKENEKVTADYLFTYGTFRHPYVQERILGRIIKGERAILRDHAINCFAAYYDIVKCPGKCVEGVILPVTDRELDRADLWEDVPLYYRTKMKAETKEKTVTAIVYVKTVKDPAFQELSDLSRLTNYSEEALKKAVDECVAAHQLLKS